LRLGILLVLSVFFTVRTIVALLVLRGSFVWELEEVWALGLLLLGGALGTGCLSPGWSGQLTGQASGAVAGGGGSIGPGGGRGAVSGGGGIGPGGGGAVTLEGCYAW